ncbi:MAG: Zn-ribbon domain-containing OB-fold protein, partial [Nocardioides sp.]
MPTSPGPPPSGPRTLQAPVTVAFDYTRSTGPVLGRFFTGLRDGVVVGGRTSSGRVLVPPPEFDPDNHEQTNDFVEVSTAGTVTAWSWCPEPVAGQPLDRPFAWVQVRLDGADGTLLHALDVPSADDVETGMRVQVRWAEEPVGAITDIACFEPETADSGFEMVPEEVAQQPSRRTGAGAPSSTTEEPESVTGIITPVELDYLYA